MNKAWSDRWIDLHHGKLNIQKIYTANSTFNIQETFKMSLRNTRLTFLFLIQVHTHTHTQMKTPFVLGTTAVNFLPNFLPLSLPVSPPPVFLSPCMVIGQFSVIIMRSQAIKPQLGVETPAAFCLILENTAIGTPCRHLQQQHWLWNRWRSTMCKGLATLPATCLKR